MAAVARTAEEISEARARAQKAAFDAEDSGQDDEVASAVYDTLQWILGDSDVDPTEEMGDDEDEDDDSGSEFD
jgi:hypothetical protein